MPVKLSGFLSGLLFLWWSLIAAGAAEPVVAVFGDSQYDHEAHRAVVARIIDEQPVAVFSVGDQVHTGNDPGEWKIFNRIMVPLRAMARYYPALGNHERNSRLYYENFALPNNERWYRVVEQGVHYFVLDSNAPLTPASAQYLWLRGELAREVKKADFTVVLFHHPLYSSSGGHAADEKGWRQVLAPLFKEYGIDAVFSGHMHNYERLYSEGVYYFVTAGAGGKLRGQEQPVPESQRFEPVHHYCTITRENDGLRIRAKDTAGREIDTVLIEAYKE